MFVVQIMNSQLRLKPRNAVVRGKIFIRAERSLFTDDTQAFSALRLALTPLSWHKHSPLIPLYLVINVPWETSLYLLLSIAAF